MKIEITSDHFEQLTPDQYDEIDDYLMNKGYPLENLASFYIVKGRGKGHTWVFTEVDGAGEVSATLQSMQPIKDDPLLAIIEAEED